MRLLKNLIGALTLLTLPDCVAARTDDVRAEFIPSPVGVTCYAIMQGGEARGGGCIRDL